MAFKNLDEVKKDIMLKSKNAISLMRDNIDQIMCDALQEYYSEYSPVMYNRTDQLKDTLSCSNIIKTKNGWAVDVYFNPSGLDYSRKKIGSIYYNNTFHGEPWSYKNDLWVFETAMAGDSPHGGYAPAGGEGIMLKVFEKIRDNHTEIFRWSLIEAGIPVE